MTKKRSMNELRQIKDSHYNNPWALYGAPKIGSEGELETEYYEAEVDDESSSYYELLTMLKDLRKQYPNDQEFGKRVAKIIR